METETQTVPVVENNVGETTSLETAPATQVVEQPQETTASPEVETGSKEPQAPEVSRRKPSDYYRERNTIRELRETVNQLQKKIEDREPLKTNKPDTTEVDFDAAHFSPDHKRILLAREKSLREAYDAKISAIEQKLDGWQESRKNAEVEQKYQEALEKLFPKTSPESNETLEQRIKRDPERSARIKEFLVESGLNEFAKVNPGMAVEIALQKLGEKSKPNPTILKKGLMGASGSGNPGQGAQRSTEQDLRSENKKFSDQLDVNPSLRFDAKFMERRALVLANLERLVKEKRG